MRGQLDGECLAAACATLACVQGRGLWGAGSSTLRSQQGCRWPRLCQFRGFILVLVSRLKKIRSAA